MAHEVTHTQRKQLIYTSQKSHREAHPARRAGLNGFLFKPLSMGLQKASSFWSLAAHPPGAGHGTSGTFRGLELLFWRKGKNVCALGHEGLVISQEGAVCVKCPLCTRPAGMGGSDWHPELLPVLYLLVYKRTSPSESEASALSPEPACVSATAEPRCIAGTPAFDSSSLPYSHSRWVALGCT